MLQKFWPALALSGMLVAVGCNSSTPSAAKMAGDSGTQNSDRKDSPEANEEFLPLRGENARLETISPDQKSETQELTRQLEKLTEQANAAQRTFDFQAAAMLWRETIPIVVKLHGKESWQSTNANLATETAEIQAKFNQTQLYGLKELFDWQSQIAALLKESRHAVALEQAERSMQRTRELFGDDSYMMAKQWVQVARMRQLSGKFTEAVEAYREAVLLHEKQLGALHPDLEALHGYLGETFLAKNQVLPALENLRKATLMAQKLWGEKSLNYATRANDLGVALQRAGDHDSALMVLRAAENIRREKLGPEDPLVAHSLLNLGTVYLELRRHELATQCFEQALPILVQKMGIGSRFVVEGHLRYSVALVLSDRAADAEQLLQHLTQKLETEPGALAELATARYRLGILQAKQGRYEAAEPNLKLALESQSRLFGEEHETSSKTKLALSRVYEQTGRTAEAKALQSQIKQVNFEQKDTQFKK